MSVNTPKQLKKILEFKRRKREKASSRNKHWVRLTRTCNNSCLFCLDKDSQDGSIVSIEKVRSDLRKGREQGIKQVVLSGGEATIHPEFLAIVRMAKKMGYRHVQVITNGRMFSYEKFLHSAVKAGVNEITLSLHGHNARLHDYQTRVKGSFRQTLSALKTALKIPGLVVSVDIVISKINCAYLYDILNFFIERGVREFDLLQVVPFGQAWENRKILFYDVEKNLPHIKRALQFSRLPDLFLWTNRFPPQYLEGFEELIQNPLKMSDDVRGMQKEFLRLMREGKPMSCRGEKCRHCFLKNFCADLIELRDKKYLASRPVAKCQPEKKRKNNKVFIFNKNFDIFYFFSFYFKNRYFIKCIRCRRCLHNGKCEGVWIEDVRKKGFGVFRPDVISSEVEQTCCLPNNLWPSDKKNKHIEINIGKICNNRCIFCKGTSTKEIFASPDKIKKEIDVMANRGYISLGLLGGEPTIYPGMSGVISYAKQRGFTDIHIVTNGRKLADKKYLEELVGAGVSRISVSIHSHLSEIEDKLTGVKGGFSQKIAGLKNLVETRKKNKLKENISINIVINRYNYKKLDETIIFFRKMGLNEFRLNFIRPYGKCLNDFDRIVPRYQEFAKYIERILRLVDKKTIGVTIADVPLCVMPKKIRKPELMGELGDYFDLVVDFKEKEGQVRKNMFSWKQLRQNSLKAKGPNCRLCKFDNICEGIWKIYAERKGFSELEPIK